MAEVHLEKEPIPAVGGGSGVVISGVLLVLLFPRVRWWGEKGKGRGFVLPTHCIPGIKRMWKQEKEGCSEKVIIRWAKKGNLLGGCAQGTWSLQG